ncbi:HAD family hydrolase [Amycolatopsis sp. NPDC059657]|uniref:HAD family hydrolase n=1 Tax=Amycolatopsis sp. NPDC059657 TaxID=3346899 RepID=UPI003672BAC0
MNTELVVLDMAGTTVADDGLVVRAFVEAMGSDEHLDYVMETMGQSKITVFRAILNDETAAQQANLAFEKAYAELLDLCEPITGAEDVIRSLRDDGVKVALTTGFSPATQQAILDALGWHDLADLALAPGEGVRGRPFPDLVLAAALRLEITDVRRVAVAGDTPSDVLTGLRAGASVVAGVLTGTATPADLAQATHVLDSIRDLPAVLKGVS